MKRRLQRRRANLRGIAKARNLSDIMKRKSRPYDGKGFSMMGSKKKPKQSTITQKQKTSEFLKKAGLHKTKAQRVSERKTFKKVFGYEQPRLSMAVGRKMPDGTIKPGKPSRYTVKAVKAKYEVVSPGTEGRYERTGPSWWSRGLVWVPGEPPIKKIVGERLVIKKHHKKSGAGKGGGSGEKTDHKTGSAKAKTSRAKAGKKGMRAGREKRKQKKNR